MATAALLSGCGEEAPRTPASLTPEKQAKALEPKNVEQRVSEILARTRELTRAESVETSRGLTLDALVSTRKTDFQFDEPEFDLPARNLPPPLPGEVVHDTAVQPHDAVALNDGAVVVAKEDAVLLVKGQRWSTLLDEGADYLQLDAEGKRLLVQHRSRIWILSGVDFRDQKLYQEHPRGRAWWALKGNKLLFVEEQLNLDATQKRRIRLKLSSFDPESEEVREADWAPRSRYAALGTLPSAGKLWGHLSQAYQIDPLPAPLLELEDGTPKGFLTSTDRAADVHPSADQPGNLFWIRTWKRNGNTGRGYFRDAPETPGSGKPFTARPAYTVSVSPSGEFIVYTIRNEQGRYEVRRIDRAALDMYESRLAAFRSANKELLSNALGLSDDLHKALRKTALGDAIREEGLVRSLDAPPDVETTREMADALRSSMAKRFGLEMEAGMPELVAVDALMERIGDYLDETPGLILALAGVFSEAVEESPAWYLEDASKNLNMDIMEPTTGDDLSYTAVAPFGIARERISGRLSLAEEAARINETAERPIYLVENFGAATLQGIEFEEWKKSGLPEDTFSLQQLNDYLDAVESNNDVVNLIIYSTARREKAEPLRLKAALALARENPTSSTALRLLGEALSDQYYTEPACEVYALAVLLDPRETGLRLSFADCLLSLNDLAGAEEQYDLIRLLDTAGIYEDILTSRYRLLKDFRAEELSP